MTSKAILGSDDMSPLDSDDVVVAPIKSNEEVLSNRISKILDSTISFGSSLSSMHLDTQNQNC